jgi:hypothetical protein
MGRARAGAPVSIYTLKVSIFEGPEEEVFLREHHEVSRTLEIRGEQTLAALHRAIFAAFNRKRNRSYEFQVGGRGPMDESSRRYVLPARWKHPDEGPPPEGVVTRTTIDALDLAAGDIFGYWFDFKASWWHQIDVVEVEEKAKRGGRAVKVVGRVGKSPPQR